MQDQHQSQIKVAANSITVEIMDEDTLVEVMDDLTPVSTVFEALESADIIDDDELDVTDRSYIKSRQHQSREEIYSMFKEDDVVVHLFMDGTVSQDDDGILFPNGVHYDSNHQILSFKKNQLKIPANRELGVGETEVGIVLDEDEDPVIVSFAAGPALIHLGQTSLQWIENTNGYLDERGVLAFDLAGGVAVLNLHERSVKCGPYKANYNPIDLPVSVLGKGLKFGDLATFDFQKGILKIGTNSIKVPWQSALNISETGVEIQVRDRHTLRRVYISNEGEQVQILANGSRLLLSPRTNVVLDKQGALAVDIDHQLVLIHLAQAKAQLGGIGVQFAKGSLLQVVRGMLKFQEGVLLHGGKRLLRYGESRIILPKRATLNIAKDQLQLSVKKKEILMRPHDKQIFIRVGGKLIILTVTVGIACDQNGNLAFDYRGNFSILDTNFMVLNIDGVKLDMGKARGVSVELIGTTAIVSAQTQPSNFLDLFKDLMSGKGLLDLIKDVGEKMSPEELLELLLTMSNPEEILSLLQQAGVQPDGALLERLKELLANVGGIDALLGQTQGVDAASLMVLTPGADGVQLQMGDRTISMPSPMEMTEALSVGGVESMLARVKGNNIQLLSLN